MRPLDYAMREYGVQERIGPQANPEVMKYFEKIGHGWVPDDETPWCAAFVGWCLEKASKPSTGLLNARSYLKYGTGTKDPVPGDIAVLWRDSRESANGHVAFFMARRNGYVYLLGGNQGDAVKVEAYPEYRVLDYRIIP